MQLTHIKTAFYKNTKLLSSRVKNKMYMKSLKILEYIEQN